MQNETTTLTQPLLAQLCTITTYDFVFVLIFELMHVKQLIKPQKNIICSEYEAFREQLKKQCFKKS